MTPNLLSLSRSNVKLLIKESKMQKKTIGQYFTHFGRDMKSEYKDNS
jgi:hypothetical protein